MNSNPCSANFEHCPSGGCRICTGQRLEWRTRGGQVGPVGCPEGYRRIYAPHITSCLYRFYSILCINYIEYIFKSYWIHMYIYIHIIMPIMNMYMIVYDIHWIIVGKSYNALS